MARNLSEGMLAALALPNLRPILLLEGEFDSGAVCVWTGYGELEWGGKTWLGWGDLLAIDPINETQNLQANGVKFTLNGLNQTIVALALQEEYQNRPIRMWFGLLWPEGSEQQGLVQDPYLIFKGRMDVLEAFSDGTNGYVYVNAENALITAMQTRKRYHTSEDQKSMYPEDLGEDFAAEIEDVEITWGNT